MQVERKALYNSLRFNWLKNQKLEVEYWQVDDYRSIALEELFALLNQRKIPIDQDAFINRAENFETPEELTQSICYDISDKAKTDQIYLICFELWRRLLPHKQSLSIFCDELDHQIHLYEKKQTDEESLQEILSYLEEILHDNADEGEDPLEIFQWITHCCAHEVESFLYNYISTQIEEEKLSYSTELIDNFSDFVQDPNWFDFLKARIVILSDREEAYEILADLSEDLAEEPDLDLSFEILQIVSESSHQQLFNNITQQILPQIQKTRDLIDLLKIAKRFFIHLNQEQRAEEIDQLLLEVKSNEEMEVSKDQIDNFKKLFE